jgi:hypothetical protein
MLQIMFTLDYELHGNGEGCPQELMLEPTREMLDQFDRHGARLTILADVAEILKFKEYAETTGHDAFHYNAITRQLQDAVDRGHDVQLHLHSSWFNARYERARWNQDWSEYNFAALPVQRMETYVRAGKQFLESLLQPVDSRYHCRVFRAANWSMQPSRNVMEVLRRNGFAIESSVFKWGRRKGLVDFDYSEAQSSLLPWRASFDDVCREDPKSPIWEFPIYAEHRWVGAFLSLNRFYRAWLSRRHRLPGAEHLGAAAEPASSSPRTRPWGWFAGFRRHAWKADFNQCTGRQLIRAVNRAERFAARQSSTDPVPFVLIGHSKLFTRTNARSLEPFLRYTASQKQRFRFGTLSEALAQLPNGSARVPEPPCASHAARSAS